MTSQIPSPNLQRAQRRWRRAFTLLELLLAIALVVVVTVILSTVLALAFKSRTAGEQSVQTMRDGELSMESIRADLQCAMPPSRGKFQGPFEGFNMQGGDANSDDLVFYGTAPAPFHPEGGNGEIKQFEITWYQPNGSNDHLLVRRTFNNLLAPDAPQPGVAAQTMLEPGRYDEEILSRNVLGFMLEFFDSNELIWQPTWDSTQQNNSLPSAVRVTLTLATPNKDASGAPVPATFVRVFQLPCFGVASGTVSGVSGGAGDSKAPAAPKAPKGGS